MSPSQVAAQLKALLAVRAWPGGSRVFSSVATTTRVATEAIANRRLPCAFLHVGPATTDPDQADLVEQSFSVFVFVAVAGDAVGENAVVGANKTGGLTASQGRGLLEIETQVKAVVQQLGPVNGVNLQEVSASDAAAISVEDVPYAATREYVFRAWCTTQDE